MHLIPESWSHFHLLVSVFPSVGLIFALGFYIAALASNNETLKRASLFVFGCLGVLALPIYLSGHGALPQLAGRSFISQQQVDAHYLWSLAAIAAVVLSGLTAWVVLLRARDRPTVPAGALKTVLGLEAVTLLLMSAAAWIG